MFEKSVDVGILIHVSLVALLFFSQNSLASRQGI
jgi:hypothetical protein